MARQAGTGDGQRNIIARSPPANGGVAGAAGQDQSVVAVPLTAGHDFAFDDVQPPDARSADEFDRPLTGPPRGVQVEVVPVPPFRSVLDGYVPPT